MEEVLGWTPGTSDQERLLAYWLFGDVFVRGSGGDVEPAPHARTWYLLPDDHTWTLEE